MDVVVYFGNCESVWNLRDVEQYVQENVALLDIMDECFDITDEDISLNCSSLITHTLDLTMVCLFCEDAIEYYCRCNS